MFSTPMLNGMLDRNVKKQSANFPPASVLPLLSSSPNCFVESATVRPNGAPIVHISNGVAYSYDSLLLSWVKLSERWWAEGSDAWQPLRQRNAALSASSLARGVVSSV